MAMGSDSFPKLALVLAHEASLQMKSRNPIVLLVLLTCLATLAIPSMGWAQSNLEKAMRFKPKQPGVEVDVPADLKQCELKSIKTQNGKSGWAVYNGNNQLIRRFIDQNGDGALDNLSYFKSGIEVYRDIDGNYDKKFDQHRWFGTAGMRWGLDPDQDGEINEWKAISPEEVSFEVVEALRTKDAERFNALLISGKEIEDLGLGEAQTEEVTNRVSKAKAGFKSFATRQDLIKPNSEWIHFSGLTPGVIPADTNGSTADVTIYDSVAAVVSNNGSSGQLAIGTLVKIGDCWRVVDLPETIVEGQALTNGGLFFRGIPATNVAATTSGGGGISMADQKLFKQYEELDKRIQQATSNKALQKLNGQRAELFGKLVQISDSDENRSNWIRQMADMVTASYLQGEYDDGVDFMKGFVKDLQANDEVDPADINYCQYRVINSFYSRKMSDATRDELEEIQDEYMKKLAQFVEANPQDPNSADAILQLALDDEAAGNTEEASDWYDQIISDFPNSALVDRSKGARTRLNAEGKVIPFTGPTLDGRRYNLADRKGKVVLIQYWATWCEPCKDDLKLIKEAFKTYGRQGFEVVSVSLDRDSNDVKKFLRNNPLPWVHLWEEGELDSPLADQLGIAMVPTMILVGADGKVIDRSLMAQDLDKLLSREFDSDGRAKSNTRSARRDDR